MKLKHVLIFSVVLNVLLLSLVVMQKGGYVSQAKNAYTKKTADYYNQAMGIIDGQNDVIAKNALLWRLVCDAEQQAAPNSKSFATLEKQIDANGFFGSPEVKTDPSTGYLTRKVGWNEDYFVIASFDKASSALKGINVGALLGHAPAMPADDAATDEDTGDADDSADAGDSAQQ
ncbi:MAG: hypothetical protein WCS54_02790 [Fibrobacteraceae bacterium]